MGVAGCRGSRAGPEEIPDSVAGTAVVAAGLFNPEIDACRQRNSRFGNRATCGGEFIRQLVIARTRIGLSVVGKAPKVMHMIVEFDEQALRAQLETLQASQDSLSSDLELLGRYGNLLIGCTDLAEVLQISQQMLSLLLPESAGTIYPLIDGEGLAEATHLWGNHVGETKLQASSADCLCMQNRQL